MSAAERLTALFVAPADALPGTPPPRAAKQPRATTASSQVPSAPPAPGRSAPRRRKRRPDRPGTAVARSRGGAVAGPAALAALPSPFEAYGLRVCVLGGGRAGLGFARTLAARLARLPGAGCAVLVSPGSEGAPPGVLALAGWPPAHAARRTARGLAAEGHAVTARGRVVEATLPGVAGEVEGVLAAIGRHAPDAPVLTHLPGPRRPEGDALLARQDLLLVVLGEAAASSLTTLVVAELSVAAPRAVVEAVPLPGRRSVAARRAAVRRALEVLR